MAKPVLLRSIGFEGADSVNKTRFARLTARLLNSYGQEARVIGLPFEMTFTGVDIKHAKELGIAKEAIPVLFAANRLEILHKVEPWVKASPLHWAVWDRTDKTGRAYALAQGNGVFPPRDWLVALDEFFPQVQVGIYLTRPIEESMEIVRRRSRYENVSAEKAELDSDRKLQIRVRQEFEKELADDPLWQTIDVSGLAENDDEFAVWERARGLAIWRSVCLRLGRPLWLEGAPQRIEELRAGMNDTRIPEAWDPHMEDLEFALTRARGAAHSRERRL